MGKIDVLFDVEGIIGATVDRIDHFGTFHYESMTYAHNNSERLHIGELTMNSDWGDNHNVYVWGEKLLLGKKNYAVYENHDSIWWRGSYTVGDPFVRKLNWKILVKVSEDGERLDFITDIDWDTRHKRICAVFPINCTATSAVWEVSYGFIRHSFGPKMMEGYNIKEISAKVKIYAIGEFPMIHWVNQNTENGGVALLSKGIPGVKWLPGCFELSLLRSPEITGDTVMPSITELWDIDGTRDSGHHCLEYSVWPYNGNKQYGEITRAGYKYNNCYFDLPFQVEGDVVVTAFKLAEDGNGFILRCQEASGQDNKLSIIFADKERSVIKSNLLEEPLEEMRGKMKNHSFQIHRHEIVSLRII